MTAAQLCILLGMTVAGAAFLGLLLRTERQLTTVYTERAALRELYQNAREDAVFQRKQLAAVTAERDQLRDDAHLQATWTIGDGGAAWTA